MATLASRQPYPAPHNMSSYRTQHTNGGSDYGTSYTRPTDPDFSDTLDAYDNVRTWDERKVSDWLRSINAEKYIELFKANNITGENLMDIDQTVLKEMGVKKVGDRVRIGSQAKLFRHKEYRRKRSSSRDSFAEFDRQTHTPPSSTSPRPPQSARSQPTPRDQKRFSKILTGTENGFPKPAALQQMSAAKNNSRPASPMHSEREDRNPHSQRQPLPSPRDKQLANNSYFTSPPSGVSISNRPTRTPTDPPQTAQYKPTSAPAETPKVPRLSTERDRSKTSFHINPPIQPTQHPLVRVIFEDGRSSVMPIDGCRSAEEIMKRTLSKAGMNDNFWKNYRFYILVGNEANYANCRRLSDSEVLRICMDSLRPERERLMLRETQYGEPEGVQLMTAAQIATFQLHQSSTPAAIISSKKSLAKIQKLTGEPLPNLTYPMSPASLARREDHLRSTALELESTDHRYLPNRPRKVDSFAGGERPESEYVVKDPATYFPDVKRDEIEKTVRMSIRRSQRLSRANSRLSTTSRLSTASNFSVSSGQGSNELPPVPQIPQAFVHGGNIPARVRPLSIVSSSRPHSYRESIASSALDSVDEEGPYEPNRKSYVSFGADSAPDSATVSVSDTETNHGQHSYFEDGGSNSPLTEAGGSLQDQLCQALAEDGEEADEELTDFLKAESWDNIKYIRGKMIGQGSFGSVYMALHTLTAELMAVKQVELPTTAGTAIDSKKNNMVEALKREIALLRDLKHPNIVQYLGSSSENNYLNIFLEYVPGGSIAKMLVDYGAMEEPMAGKLVRQILVGLAYLHSKDIIHRDIKGANILVDTHGDVKISDFGISKRVQDSKTLLSSENTANAGGKGGVGGRGAFANNRVSLQGSVFWMAPEVVKQTAYTRKADIWSLGCLVVEMLTGSHPHPNCTQLQAIFKIGGKSAVGASDPSPDLPAKASREAKDLLRSTFKVEYEDRPEAEQLLGMAWVRGRA